MQAPIGVWHLLDLVNRLTILVRQIPHLHMDSFRFQTPHLALARATLMGWLTPGPLCLARASLWTSLEQLASGSRPRQVQGARPLDRPVVQEVRLDRPGHRQEDHPVFLGPLAPRAGPRVAL